MDLFNYIKKNYKTPNPYVVKSLGGSEELVEYLRNTPWNTNLNMLSAYEGGGEPADCQRTDLGTLIYCGRIVAHLPLLSNTGVLKCADGVAVCDEDYWKYSIVSGDYPDYITYLNAVVDGQDANTEVVDDTVVEFKIGGKMVASVYSEFDAETGDFFIYLAGEASHIAIYSTKPMA